MILTFIICAGVNIWTEITKEQFVTLSCLLAILYLSICFMCSLKYINVAMVTVLKNVTNVITALGEMYLFKKHHDGKVWASLFLMVC